MKLTDWINMHTRNADAGGAGGGGGEAGAGAAGGAAPDAGVPAAGAGGGGQPAAGAGGGAPAPWWETTLEPGPVRDLMAAKRYGEKAPDEKGVIRELANSYWNANRALNGNDNVVPIPGENATQDEIKAFRSRMGIPDDVNGYDQHIDLSKVRNVDQGTLDFGKNLMHELGVPASKAQTMIDRWEEFVGKMNEDAQVAAKTANENEIAELKRAHGAEFDTMVENGRKAVKTLGLSDAALARIEDGIGGGAVMELMARLGKGLREGRVGDPNPNPADTALSSPQAAQREISRLQGDSQFQEQYNNAQHPLHKEAVQRMAQLFATANAKAS